MVDGFKKERKKKWLKIGRKLAVAQWLRFIVDREEHKSRKRGGEQRVEASNSGISGASPDPVREQLVAHGHVRGWSLIQHERYVQREQQQQ